MVQTRSTDCGVAHQKFLLRDRHSETPIVWDSISKAAMLLWQIRSTRASRNFRDPIACESFQADNGTQIVSVE